MTSTTTVRLDQVSPITLHYAIRLDHFRGFEAYWEVPAGAETAKEGRWVKGPGARLFDALRDALGLSGMKVLQFTWSTAPELAGKLREVTEQYNR